MVKLEKLPTRRAILAGEYKLLADVSAKYGIRSKVEDLCFAFILDQLIENSKINDKLKSAKALVDVGCGHFRYGHALSKVLKGFNPEMKIIALDKKKMGWDYSPAMFIHTDVQEFLSHIDQVNVFSVFNPFPKVPDLSKAPKGSILIGCVDWNVELFKKSLEENGFEALSWMENPFKELMVGWFNNYNPFVVAIKNN